MSFIRVSYDSQEDGSFQVEFLEFLGEDVPRSFVGTASFSTSANGASVLGGAPSADKHIWAISSPLTQPDTQALYDMYKAWDKDRAAGYPVGCTVRDETFMEVLEVPAVFSTPPSFARLGGYGYQVDFGMTEI